MATRQEEETRGRLPRSRFGCDGWWRAEEHAPLLLPFGKANSIYPRTRSRDLQQLVVLFKCVIPQPKLKTKILDLINQTQCVRKMKWHTLSSWSCHVRKYACCVFRSLLRVSLHVNSYVMYYVPSEETIYSLDTQQVSFLNKRKLFVAKERRSKSILSSHAKSRARPVSQLNRP